VGGATFLGTLMDRYQVYFILASVGFVGLWLVWSALRDLSSRRAGPVSR
jgi:hypothetical protein